MNKEHLALRNNFRVTKKFLIAKFDCTNVRWAKWFWVSYVLISIKDVLAVLHASKQLGSNRISTVSKELTQPNLTDKSEKVDKYSPRVRILLFTSISVLE